MRKKKPVLDIWIICEKRQAKNAQKLHALLTDCWKAKITIVEIDRKSDPPRLVQLPKRKIRELWRELARPVTSFDRYSPSRNSQGLNRRIL
jgi:hypothetical protein